MSKNKIILHINKIDLLKLNVFFCYNILFKGNSNNNNLLLSNYIEIEEILNSDIKEITYILYCYRFNIHKILYEEDKNIHLNNNNYNRNLSYYFYLNLLINNEESIINYEYSIDLINDIITYQSNINDKHILKKIIISKIITDLIDNYKNRITYNENDEIYLDKIEKENIDIINYNINNLKELNIGEKYENNILKEKIDTIYMNIINSLFKNNKLIDYEYTIDIFNQMEFETIDLTENMIKELLNILDIKNDYVKKYMIININDVFNENKINFYYIIFKYIFKKNYYIYIFPFLYETRKNILAIINNNLEQISSFVFNSSDKIINKIEYILKRITDSEYYYDKYFNYHYKIKPILNYYKNYLFESKKEDIILIENMINNSKKSKLNYSKYLEDYDTAQKMNVRFPIIDYLLKKSNKSNIKSETQLNIYIKYWENLEKSINSKIIENIKDEDKKILYEYINISNDKNILNKIFIEDIYKWLLTLLNYNNVINNTQLSSITSENNMKYDIINNTDFNSFKTQEKSIDNNEIINIKEDIYYNNESVNNNGNKKGMNENCDIFENDQLSESDSFNYGNDSFWNTNNNDIYSLSNFIKIFDNNNHRNTSEYMKEISNGNLISYGIDSKIYLYRCNNETIEFEEPLLQKKDDILNCEEIKDSLIICTKKKVKKLYLDNYSTDSIDIDSSNSNFTYLAKIKDNTFFVCKENSVLIVKDFTHKMSHQREEISKGIFFKVGIKINDNIIALTSNRVISGGKDIILFYDMNEKKKEKLENYSFIFTSAGLCLMEINNNQILFCACKEYIKGQKNGILLINNVQSIFNENYDKNVNIKFINTNFDVHCFCQISYLDDNNNKKIFNKSKAVLMKKNYFLMGGLDTKKGEGCIKLCKINDELEIEEIEEIRCKETINSIIQLSSNGDIIISCWNGIKSYIKYKNLKKCLDNLDDIEAYYDIEHLIKK